MDCTEIFASNIDVGASGTKNVLSESATPKLFHDGTNWKVVTDAETLDFTSVTVRDGGLMFRILGSTAVLTVDGQTEDIQNITGTKVVVDNIGNPSDPVDEVVGLKLISDNGLVFDDKVSGNTIILDKDGVNIKLYFDGVNWKAFILPASAIPYDNSSGELSADNVQDAIDELSVSLVESEFLINGFSLAATQEPTLTDTPLQIEFGAAQGSGSDPVQLLADGTVQINDTGTYDINVSLQYGRTGQALESLIHFRLLVDGVQLGRTASAKLLSDKLVIPFSHTFVYNGTVGEELTFEVIRDSTGNNSGGLFAEPTTLVGLADSSSASIIVTRSNI